MSDTTQPIPQKAALGYLRISDKKQIKGESKANQKASIQAYADANNIRIIKWFYDEAKSGKNADREELTNLLKTAIKMKGQIDFVIVYKMSRASRDVASYVTQIRSVLAAKGIMIRSATEPFDESPMGQFIETLYVSVAQLDNDTKREMVVDNMTRIAKQGYWQHKPLRGYKKAKINNSEGQPRPSMEAGEEANKVTDILMRFNRGDIGEAALCRYATSIGFLSLQGKQLTQELIHKMIIRPEYAGFVHDKFTNYEVVDGKHKGLISKEVYDQNQIILKSKNKDYLLGLKHNTINMMYPLRRFVLCAQCNKYLTACNPSNSPRYFCHRPSCRGTGSMHADLVHAKFEQLLATIEPKPSTIKLMKEIIKRQTVKELGNINQDIAKKRDKLDELATFRADTIKSFISGKISEEDKQIAIDSVDCDKLDAKQDLDELEQQQTLSESNIEYALNFMGNIAKQWSDAPLDLKQKFQNLIFPKGFVLDIKNDNFIISEISPLYTYINDEMAASYATNFAMVIPRRIELRLPG
jgi:site-specific DNA recombinase